MRHASAVAENGELWKWRCFRRGHRWASDDKRSHAAPRGGRVQAPWRHAQRGRSAAETLDAAEHGGMLAFLSEAGHHASDTNLDFALKNFNWRMFATLARSSPQKQTWPVVALTRLF